MPRDGITADDMDSLIHATEEDERSVKLSRQAVSFFLHTALAIFTWLALMVAGYALNPAGVPQWMILLASFAVPLLVGVIVNMVRQDEMAVTVWLIGLIWLLIISLWILDMPTGPNACFQCGAVDKLTRTFFSLPSPSGLIDDDGPFIGTWPAAALIGYAIGAKLVLRKKG
jgi:hypothetical protein